MKHLLSTTAMTVMLTWGGIAAAQTTQDPLTGQPNQVTPEVPQAIIWSKASGEWLSDDLIGARVVNEADETLGEIEYLVISLRSEGGSTMMPDAETAPADDTAASEEPLPEQPAGEGAQDTAEAPAQEEGEAEDLAASETEPLPEGSADEDAEVTAEAAPREDRLPMAADDEGAGGVIREVVIGMGGFLGIGEKQVAVPFERLMFFTGDNDGRKIVLNATSEELEAMPDYVEPGPESAPLTAE